MDLGLQDKVVLISGSYRGTGAATAKVFCDEGAAVAIHGHDEGQADSTVESIRRRGGNAIAVHGSLQASESVESIFAQVEEAIGTVDVPLITMDPQGTQAGPIQQTSGSNLGIPTFSPG